MSPAPSDSIHRLVEDADRMLRAKRLLSRREIDAALGTLGEIHRAASTVADNTRARILARLGELELGRPSAAHDARSGRAASNADADAEIMRLQASLAWVDGGLAEACAALRAETSRLLQAGNRRDGALAAAEIERLTALTARVRQALDEAADRHMTEAGRELPPLDALADAVAGPSARSSYHSNGRSPRSKRWGVGILVGLAFPIGAGLAWLVGSQMREPDAPTLRATVVAAEAPTARAESAGAAPGESSAGRVTPATPAPDADSAPAIAADPQVLPANTASPSPTKPATRDGVASTHASPAARSRRAVASTLLSAAHQANTWREQDAALDALHAAIALDPENGAARVALAIHLARGGNREGAKRNLAYLASLKTDGARAALRDARSNPVVRDLVPVPGR